MAKSAFVSLSPPERGEGRGEGILPHIQRRQYPISLMIPIATDPHFLSHPYQSGATESEGHKMAKSSPSPRLSGDLSRLGSGERNAAKPQAREGRASGHERVIGPG